MATAVIGAFDDATVVRKVIDELVEAGCQGVDIEVLEGDEEEIVAEVVERGFDERQARVYAKAVSRGKTLVAARAPDEKADRAMAIMERYEEGSDNDEHEESSRRREAQGRTNGQEESVAEVEEELVVGKRKVAQGGARVTSHVVEQPVEKTVRLREEEVEIERQPVDRELSPEEADAAFEERTVEMTETDEEVEVRKEARVIEEVNLSKRAEEREQKVRDKVRRTEVEVEKIDAPKSRKGR